MISALWDKILRLRGEREFHRGHTPSACGVKPASFPPAALLSVYSQPSHRRIPPQDTRYRIQNFIRFNTHVLPYNQHVIMQCIVKCYLSLFSSICICVHLVSLNALNFPHYLTQFGACNGSSMNCLVKWIEFPECY